MRSDQDSVGFLPRLPAAIEALIRDSGAAQWNHEKERAGQWSPSVCSDYPAAFAALVALPEKDGLFLEWGSGFGVITLMAAYLGFDACGIERDSDLVAMAEDLASRHGLEASFAPGTFFPDGSDVDPFRDDPTRVDEIDEDGYQLLDRDLSEFDVIYAYPWPNEEELFLDLFERGAKAGATLLFNLGPDGIQRRVNG